MKIAIEKENLVFDSELKPVHKIAHNMSEGIELDFADHQIELISEPFATSKQVIEQIEEFMANEEFKSEYFWPLSVPKTEQNDFTITGTRTREEREYRKSLLERYGIEKMLVSGIHINYSDCEQEDVNLEEYYFELLKRIYIFGPLLSQFVSFSPYDSSSYNGKLTKIGKNYGKVDMISLRNSNDFGYGNEHQLGLDYTDYHSYRASINKVITSGKINSEKELYAKVRHKGNYVELRFVDLNPYERAGISEEILELFALTIKTIKDIEIKEFDNEQNLKNFDLVAINGLNKNMVLTINGCEKKLSEHTEELLTRIISKFQDDAQIVEMIKKLQNQYDNNTLPLYKMIEEYHEKDYSNDEFGLRHIKHQTEYEKLLPELSMELSSKILISEAMKNNLKVNIIDQQANFIEIANENKNELIVQATKTNLDSYANILAMENKYVTKYLLEKEGIKVPNGMKINALDEVDYQLFTKKMVVKPLDTNFGQGITILEANPTKQSIDQAIKFALKHSTTVIIEQFAQGVEYRFLVIDGVTRSIVNRVAANVIGDGIHTIKELVAFKNSNTIRNKSYVTPVEYLQLGEFETKYLADQGLKWEDIPLKEQQVFLRENSNVSTGGDSYEVFEKIPEYFKIQAAKAAEVLGVKICGIDMIIDDLNSQEYSIIEANFNPAIQMHTFPFVGKGKNVANDILKALKLI